LTVKECSAPSNPIVECVVELYFVRIVKSQVLSFTSYNPLGLHLQVLSSFVQKLQNSSDTWEHLKSFRSPRVRQYCLKNFCISVSSVPTRSNFCRLSTYFWQYLVSILLQQLSSYDLPIGSTISSV